MRLLETPPTGPVWNNGQTDDRTMLRSEVGGRRPWGRAVESSNNLFIVHTKTTRVNVWPFCRRNMRLKQVIRNSFTSHVLLPHIDRRQEGEHKGSTLTFPFSYRWGGGGWGLGGEVARTIQEGAPLVVQPVALEAGQQVEEAVLSDGVMWRGLRRCDKE